MSRLYISMKQILMAILTLHAAAARPSPKDAGIIFYENFNDGSGNYHYAFKTTNGITQEQTGRFHESDQGEGEFSVQGSFSYTAPEEILHEVYYAADEDGYRPHVSVRSVPPPQASPAATTMSAEELNILEVFGTPPPTLMPMVPRQKQTEGDTSVTTMMPMCTNSTENGTEENGNLIQNGTEVPCFNIPDRINKKAQITILGSGAGG